MYKIPEINEVRKYVKNQRIINVSVAFQKDRSRTTTYYVHGPREDSCCEQLNKNSSGRIL